MVLTWHFLVVGDVILGVSYIKIEGSGQYSFDAVLFECKQITGRLDVADENSSPGVDGVHNALDVLGEHGGLRLEGRHLVFIINFNAQN